MSINSANKPKKGRPPADTEAVNLRLPRDILDAIEAVRREKDVIPTRPEAIREIVREWLADKGYLSNESATRRL